MIITMEDEEDLWKQRASESSKEQRRNPSPDTPTRPTGMWPAMKPRSLNARCPPGSSKPIKDGSAAQIDLVHQKPVCRWRSSLDQEAVNPLEATATAATASGNAVGCVCFPMTRKEPQRVGRSPSVQVDVGRRGGLGHPLGRLIPPKCGRRHPRTKEWRGKKFIRTTSFSFCLSYPTRLLREVARDDRQDIDQ